MARHALKSTCLRPVFSETVVVRSPGPAILHTGLRQKAEASLSALPSALRRRMRPEEAQASRPIVTGSANVSLATALP